jgi:8-oxo-dGTP diphosphatase
MIDDTTIRYAAVSLIERKDGRILCVWNRRYNGWSLPGGMVEPGESIEDGQTRELHEETGLDTYTRERIFEGEHGIEAKEGRASRVVIFRVVPVGMTFDGDMSMKAEEGCPIAWKTREEFLAESPFAEFYKRAFAVISDLED